MSERRNDLARGDIMECAGRALSGDGALAPGVANSVPYLLRRLLARVAARRASPRAAQRTRKTCALSVGIKLGFQIPVMLW